MTKVALLFIILIYWLWWWFDNLRTQTLANRIVQHLCMQLHLQWLDDTAALVRTRLRYEGHWQWTVQRTYQFEFSDDGERRVFGKLWLGGQRLEKIEIVGHTNLEMLTHLSTV